MIFVDTTFLVDLWRTRDANESSVVRLLAGHAGEQFVVPAHAAGEFLEGGALVSEKRLLETLDLLRGFKVEDIDLETAVAYARVVSSLRRSDQLAGRSKPDMWIAAAAIRHGARLATRNVKHFSGIPSLGLVPY